jgi:serine/threonine-protein kinase PknK
VLLADDVIREPHLSPVLLEDERPPAADLDLKAQVDLLERRLIASALERTQGNQTRAAELLGVSRYGLQKMIKRLGLSPKRNVRSRGGSG